MFSLIRALENFPLVSKTPKLGTTVEELRGQTNILTLAFFIHWERDSVTVVAVARLTIQRVKLKASFFSTSQPSSAGLYYEKWT